MLTRILIAVNVIAFGWEYLSGAFTGSVNSQNNALLNDGALYGLAVQHGEWWRIFTSAFLHANLLHIGFNMFALWQVGQYVELIYGTPRMALIYFIAALGSGLLVTFWVPDTLTIGASGAIFGLFGALGVAGFRLGAAGRAMLNQTFGIIVINLVYGFFSPTISYQGHIGGLVAGTLAAFVVYRTPKHLMLSVQQPQPQPQPQPPAEATAYPMHMHPDGDRSVVTIEHEPIENEPSGHVPGE